MSPILDYFAPVLRTAITGMSRRSLPQTEGEIHLSGLSSPVEIFRDRWGVPHIYAQRLADLFFAQGYIHAQDRLWQMELNRRTAQGRLSELFGEIALDTDRMVRTFGFNRLGKTDWENADAGSCEALQAYAAGVNAFLLAEGRKLPAEFSLIRHRPEPWQPVDSTAFMRVMTWQLSHAWFGEAVRAQLIERVGEAYAAELEIQYPEQNPSTLPRGIEWNAQALQNLLEKDQESGLNRGLGSNAWVVSGRKSQTGNPYLCNDMHLAVSMPGLWYQAHLVCDDFQVTGVTLPGMPGVLVGHNDHIAWGMTLAMTDCEDLFIERFDPQQPTRYQTEQGWKEATVIREAIRVKGKADSHVEEVLLTRHGPVISDVIGLSGGDSPRLAVQSMALRPSRAFSGWMLLDRASNWEQFVEAMRLIEAPQLNVAYADREGNIGYWATGLVPIRAAGDGRTPAPGWNGEYEWIGEVPFDQMPHALNPADGYLVTCNHRIIGEDYPYFLGNVWMNGYRANRIAQVLESKDRLGPEDFEALHLDFTCIPGAEFVQRLQDLHSDDPDIALALSQLRAWDGKLTAESIGGALYEVARYMLVHRLLDPGLGEELAHLLMGKGAHPLLYTSSEFYGHDTVTMLRLLDHPDSWWVVQAGGREQVILRSLKDAVTWLRSNLGPDLNQWQWGKLHRITFAHALSLQKPLDKVFDRGPFPIGGDTDTPCQTGMYPQDPYDNKAWSPSFRQIVDLGDLSKSVTIAPPGQSGQLGNPHYDDLIAPWLNGNYHPQLWTREQVERETIGRLKLEPA